MNADVVLPGDLASLFQTTSFRWPFRRYQTLALDGYERGRVTDSRRSYIVMPPGAGKTAVGLEIARRRGSRTLVLCPNTAVQAQWLRQWEDFQPHSVDASAEVDLTSPLTILTYQAICNVNGDDQDLEEQARVLWVEELQRESGLTTDEAERKIDDLSRSGSRQFEEAMAGFRRQVRRHVVRDGNRDDLLGLLHPNGRAIIERMTGNGPWTLVLDECHHLLQMWGSLVRALVQEIGEQTFVVGLTATPPSDMDAREATLYQEIFGKVDFEVPTPAVVKEGDLAPYQELVYLTSPLDHEAAFIAEQHERFEELLTRLMDPDFASRPFIDWIRVRVVERQGRNGAHVSWARFERDEPDLAQAALRLFWSKHLPIPEGARIGERHRQPPLADDWVALVDDYCTGCLRDSTDPRDARAWQEIRHALPSLGYVLTRTGIRSYVSPVDRVLSLSASKAVAASMILERERADLGSQLRALILCDYERAGSDLLAKLRGVLDPQAGSASLLLQQLIASQSVAELDPVLVTGRTVACSRATGATLLPWIEQNVPDLKGALSTEALVQPLQNGEDQQWQDVIAVRPRHSWWRPRNYVPLLTRYFEQGASNVLVGTRGLLGEGWDAKRVNVLIDLTTASTSTSVHQMRGRSLRLDPALPRKVANNWDVVCVAPEHPKGVADYARFVRKHRSYYAPTAAGEIESGVSHVHAELSPYGPPQITAFSGINVAMLRRAGDRGTAYDLWKIGEPYVNVETRTVRIRPERSIGVPNHRLLRHDPSAGRGLRLRAVGVLALAVVAGAGTASVAPDLLGIGGGLVLASGGGFWLNRSFQSVVRRLGPSDSLEDLASAVVEALRDTGGIPRQLGPASVRIVAQEDGFYRCFLDGATLEESALFADSMDELLSPLAAPRYIIPRYVVERPGSFAQLARIYAHSSSGGRTGANVVYHAVPAFLAANKERAASFARSWNRYVSAGKPLFWKDPQAQAILAVQQGEDPFEITTQMRSLWR